MLVAEQFKLDQIFSKLSGLRRVALAVSGGSDSVALLRLVGQWASTQSFLPEITILTVNHGLRESAAAEAERVANWSTQLGFAHCTLQWTHTGVANGIQAKARAARYDLMTEWCKAHDVAVLLTGHTADDQAETVAMRQARTDSLQSIAGIWPELDWSGIRVLRPLLKARRTELRDYLNQLGQDWIDDPSNADLRFERVRVRNKLNGELCGLDQKAAAAQEFVERKARANKLWCESNCTIHDTGFVTIRRKALAKLDQTEFDLVITWIVDLCGQSARKPERQDRLRLQGWLLDEKVGRRTLGGALFAKRKNVVIVAREPGRISKSPQVFGVNQDLIWDERFQLKGPLGALVVPVRDVGPLARRIDIPAFVQVGLPVIMLNDQIWSIPHLAIGNDVFVKFLRH